MRLATARDIGTQGDGEMRQRDCEVGDGSGDRDMGKTGKTCPSGRDGRSGNDDHCTTSIDHHYPSGSISGE